jgi:hypothetical protein
MAAVGAVPAVQAPQQPCPRCEQQRQQTQARLHRHRAKAAAAGCETLQNTTAENVAGDLVARTGSGGSFAEIAVE